MRGATSAVVVVMLATGLLCGCRVESNKHGDGEDVKVATPFGGMSVKTDDSAVTQATGLPVYPGATVFKKNGKDDHDSGAADINMSFGSFQLRVKAVSYTTPDSPDQVLAFYKKNMIRFGTFIQCKDHKAVGTPTRTSEGLDCSDNDEKTNHVYVSDDTSDKSELKAGSKQHQHIVSIDADGTGTKFGLVALDLPGHLSFGDKDGKDADKDEGKQ